MYLVNEFLSSTRNFSTRNRLKPRSSPFWQINDFHWKSPSPPSWLWGGLGAQTEVWFLVTKLLVCLQTPVWAKPRKKKPSLELLHFSGQDWVVLALPVRETERKFWPHPSPAHWPWRTLCPAPASDSGSVETRLDIIIYGVLVTWETK